LAYLPSTTFSAGAVAENGKKEIKVAEINLIPVRCHIHAFMEFYV
jgi:hypothetical protein